MYVRLTFAVLVLCLACSYSGLAQSNADWDGTWDVTRTDYGSGPGYGAGANDVTRDTLTLHVEGDKVSGTFGSGGSLNGSLSRADYLDGEWSSWGESGRFGFNLQMKGFSAPHFDGRLGDKWVLEGLKTGGKSHKSHCSWTGTYELSQYYEKVDPKTGAIKEHYEGPAFTIQLNQKDEIKVEGKLNDVVLDGSIANSGEVMEATFKGVTPWPKEYPKTEYGYITLSFKNFPDECSEVKGHWDASDSMNSHTDYMLTGRRTSGDAPAEAAKPEDIKLTVERSQVQDPNDKAKLMDDDTHPLSVVIKLTADGKPVPNAKLKVHAFDLPENDKKLAEYFAVSSCDNCLWGARGDEKVALICDGFKPIYEPTEVPGRKPVIVRYEPICPRRQKPLEVHTDENGIVKMEFFLDLEKIGDDIPEKGKPISIPVKAEYWDESGEKIADGGIDLKLEHIALVESITVETPLPWDPRTGATIENKNPKAGREKELAIYYDPITRGDDPGTSNGLKRSERVRIIEEEARAAGQHNPGGKPFYRQLNVSDKLYLGDKIYINAENIKWSVGNQERSGIIWVQIRFLDGFVGKAGVSGNVPSHYFTIGKTPEETGFMGAMKRFLYIANDVNDFSDTVPTDPKDEGLKWAAKNIAPYYALGPEAAIAYEAYSMGKKVAKGIDLFLLEHPVFIRIKSEVTVDYDGREKMVVTTREGNATIFTEATGDEGFAVPAGKTAVIGPDLKPVLSDTDPETAKRSDEVLGGMGDPVSESPIFSGPGAESSTGNESATTPGNGHGETSANPGSSGVTGGNNPGSSTSTPSAQCGTGAGTPAISGNGKMGVSAQASPGGTIKQAISPAGSWNWYKVWAGTNGILSVNVGDVPNDMRPDVRLYDKNFNLFEDRSASVAGDDLRVRRDIPGPGWIYIAVYDADGKAHADPYSLTVDFSPVQDGFDPNNVIGDAVEVRSGQAVTASICPRGEWDWYRILADSNGILSVNVEGVPKDMRTDVRLYDRDFKLFEDKSASAAGDELRFERDVPAPGWIYIAVYDADGKARAEPYTLTADFKPVQDASDPNNVIGDAAEVGSGQAVTASICPRGEWDWYKVNAAAGSILSVNVETAPKDMRTDVRLYDKNFNLFEDKGASAAGDSLKFEKDVPLPGWVYIAVYDADGKPHTEPYTLAVA